MPKIVILGGGYGGVLTAKKLLKKFKKNKDVELTLIDKKPYHTMLTELHEVAAGRVDEESIKLEFGKIFAERNIDVVLDEIKTIDFEKKRLISDNNSYDYDYLVIGTGCKPAFYGVEGAEKYALQLWSYEDAVKIREHVLDMFRKAEKETDKQKRSEYLSFAVVGAGFTGIEMIGELAEWTVELCKKFSIDRREVKLTVVDMMPTILPHVPPKLIKAAEKILKKLNVEWMTDSYIVEVKENTICMRDNCILNTRTVIWATGVEGAEITEDLDVEKKERNRIVTASDLSIPEYPNVYVVGDSMYYIPKGKDKPVPQMVENCEHSAPVIAHNIFCDIKGGEKKEYEPHFHGVMVSIGGKHGIAHVGTEKRMYCFRTFIAMFIKHLINLFYFFQVAGWNKCYSYLMHEIFHVKNGRSFVGSYFSKSSPNFWKVPLRLFLGFMWLREGINKIPNIFDDFNNIFLFNLPADGVSAVSAATDGAEQWGEALPVPGFIESIVEWSLGVFIAPIAPYFQAFIVFAEIILGLMLIGGLFSAFASVATAALCVMIYFSGMASEEIIWYFVAAIATIGGSGSTFGLDYYVLPYLKKHWKKAAFVKKWYIYND